MEGETTAEDENSLFTNEEHKNKGFDVEEDGEDDFGDFKEVPCKQMPQFSAAIDDNSFIITNREQNLHEHTLFYPQSNLLFDLPLNRLLIKGANKFWQVPDADSINEKRTVFINPNCANPCDIFLFMNTGTKVNRDAQLLDNFIDKAFHLWSNICYIDEVSALEFKWKNSWTYQYFLHSLHCKTRVFRKSQQPNKKRRKQISIQME